MKLLVVLFGLLAAVAAEEFPPIWRDYHAEVGIPAARRIRLMEESIDFDGSRIAGGQPGQLGAHPHLGGLVIAMSGGLTSVCGSSLLTSNRGLTAAHCWRHGMSQANSFTVVFGSILLFSGGHRTVTSNVTPHPNYNMLTLNNDIAIIRFNNPVPLSSNIATIPIATGSNLFTGQWVSAAGFGANGHNVPITQGQAKHVASLLIITNAACQQTYGSLVVASSVVCASTAHGQSTCPGDSGGPLVAGGPSQASRLLMGVTSFGHRDGCQSGHHVGFARVSSFTAWINGQL